MKKLMLIVALAATVTSAYAQKSEEAIKKAVANAQAACENPKKADKPATWLTLAKANMDAYTTAQGQGWLGGNKQEIAMVTGVKPIETVTETLGDIEYTVDVYANAKYYYAPNGSLQMIDITKPIVENALSGALDAFRKAAELDVKNAKIKEITEGIEKIASDYQTEAMNAYYKGDYKSASVCFASAAAAVAGKPLEKIDSASIYNSGQTAYFAGDLETAKACMKRCININYLAGGDVYAKLAECYKAQKDTVSTKSTLEEAFAKFPENQGILIGLINLYLDTKDDPEKLFALLEKAKVNEPTNASLYYVEGNIRKQLGQIEKAVEAYDQCAIVNPKYEFGFIGKGLLYWEEAVKIQGKAENEFNDKEYEKLVQQFETACLNAADPFTKAFEMTQDAQIKLSLADYLKNIYFRFRDKGPDYENAYNKFNEYSKSAAE
ncbi:MAG: hypothetical protein MJY49_02530 [Bacteroidales bacterium]|nr:hypothetical protein [Bacteroidales bacterium]